MFPDRLRDYDAKLTNFCSFFFVDFLLTLHCIRIINDNFLRLNEVTKIDLGLNWIQFKSLIENENKIVD